MFTYHNYQSLQKKLFTLEQTYPNISRVYSIGKSVAGRELYVFEISDNPGYHEPGMMNAKGYFKISTKMMRKLC